MSEISPFIPGARVAVSEKWSNDVTEAFVEKVHKNGNFTLRGSKQQWSPWHTTWGGERWSAHETGTGYGRRRLDIWDDVTDKEIAARIDATKTKKRWRDIRSKVDQMKEPTAAMCDAIETALAMPR